MKNFRLAQCVTVSDSFGKSKNPWMLWCAFVFMTMCCVHTPAALAQEVTGGDPPDQIIPVIPPPALLDENCVVSILNRTTQVRADGTWNLPNVPANFGPVRARATCVRNGVTLFGQSELFTLAPNQNVTLPHITLGNVSSIPQLIGLTVPGANLTQAGQTAQLTVLATYQGGATQNITSSASGTQYLVSNPAIATVSPDGLVTAAGSGAAIVQAFNEGAQGVIKISVALSVDSDADGIPDDAELRLGLNPLDPTDAFLDADHDGLTNLQEFQTGTDIQKADSDGDGLTDGQEVLLYHTNPLVISSDGSGIPDGIEVQTGTLGATLVAKIAAALASIEVQPGTFVLSVNTIEGQAMRQLTVLGHLIDGKTTLDLTSTQKGTNYSSSNLNVCNFGSPDGNVFAGSTGSCTITVSNGAATAQTTGVVRSFAPTPLSFVSVPGFANGVAVNGGFAYVAAGSAGLRVINVSDRAHPVIVAALALAGNANGIKLIGSLAIIAAGAAGIHAVDVSNPLAPILRSTLATSSTALDVAIAGNIAYVANTTGLFLANISNPVTMTRISSLSLAGSIRGIAVDAQRGLAVVAADTNGVYIVDVSNPLIPVQRSQVPVSNARQVVIKGNNVFVANFSQPYQSSLVALDISNSAAPTILSSITNQSLGGNLNDVVVDGNFALAADVFFVNGVPITDISNPNSLQSRATLNFPQRDDNGLGIATDGIYVYLTTDHSAIGKFGTTGDGRLYIGQYRAQEDINGIPPAVTITSPVSGTTVVEGAKVAGLAVATDDIAVAGVTFTVNGQAVFTATTAPYQFTFTVPAGVSAITLGAIAADLGGNTGNAAAVVLNVIPDPGTTVVGRVLNNNTAVSGATVTTNGGKSSTTAADGRFTIPNVPTAQGDIVVTASATIGGSQVSRMSAPRVPVAGGTTDVGDIQMTPSLITFEGIAGIIPMSNSGVLVPAAARLSAQLQLSQGVRFSSTVDYIAVVNLGVGHATSGANGVGGVNVSNVLSYASPIIVTFTVPGDPSTPAVTDFVSIRGDLAPGAGTATMEAFGLNGILLGSVTRPDIAGGALSLSIPGIHSIRVTETQANIAFDDLSFNSPRAP